jgi:hypothetical protein
VLLALVMLPESPFEVMYLKPPTMIIITATTPMITLNVFTIMVTVWFREGPFELLQVPLLIVPPIAAQAELLASEVESADTMPAACSPPQLNTRDNAVRPVTNNRLLRLIKSLLLY